MYNRCVFAILFIFTQKTTIFGDVIEDYEIFINNSMIEAQNYQLDLNAYRYKPNVDVKPIDFGAFDFIIIGASPSGCVIANRLSEIRNWKILLIEAGNNTNGVLDIPGISGLGLSSDYNWGFKTEPQKNACLGYGQQKCICSRGRGLGGGSLVNSLTVSRGNPTDFNKWSEFGIRGWSYKEVLPYFLKLEDFHKTNPKAPVDLKYHHVGGYHRVEFGGISNSRTEAFINAHLELGFNLTDYNGEKQVGVSPVQFNENHGHRLDTGTAYIKPIQSRKNLKIMLNSYVTKVEIDKHSKKAKSVHFSSNGKSYIAHTKKEIILSAGTFQSAQLLMLSGVGPRKHLQKNNVEVIQDLQVGSFLKEHVYFSMLISHNSTDDINSTLKEDIQKFLQDKGDLTAHSQISTVAFYQSKFENSSNYPDIEYLLTSKLNPRYMSVTSLYTPETVEDVNNSIGSATYFVINVNSLHTKSTGTLRLKNGNPFEYPIIDPNLYGINEDLDRSYEAVLQVKKLIQTKAMKKLNSKLISLRIRGCEPFDESKRYWTCILKKISMTGFHPISTCPMGSASHKEAVVNSNLTVFGVQNLRVADASVFPITLSNHPTITCVMIGEKLSDIIKNKYI